MGRRPQFHVAGGPTSGQYASALTPGSATALRRPGSRAVTCAANPRDGVRSCGALAAVRRRTGTLARYHGPAMSQERGSTAISGVEGRIVATDLTKVFGEVRAVDGLSFSVEPGSVTGFLGPNGAGKTTTLRMILGLAEPTSGRGTISGVTYAHLTAPGRTVGAVLEATSFHPGRTARNHLRVFCAAAGLPDARADEVLDLVGLTQAARFPVRGFSLGMRQRLGLATALLGNPRVLLLDEPANGLDPEDRLV